MASSSTRLKAEAREFLRAERADVQPAQLQALLERGARHVQSRQGPCSEIAARQAMIEAWSELAAERSRCYVDLAASTPQLLVFVDEVTNTRRLVPVIDLARILGPRVAA